MPRFRSQRQAKEYLVSHIVAEAERENIPLTDIERKMLYFSETDCAPPGTLEAAAFARDYDDADYEHKIALLVRNLQANPNPEEQSTWDDAVLKLCDGDHYLLTLIDAGSGQSSSLEIPNGLLHGFQP